MAWAWLQRWLLPSPVGDGAASSCPTVTDLDVTKTLDEVDEATKEFEQIKRRARSVGIDVDVIRGWGPRA